MFTTIIIGATSLFCSQMASAANLIRNGSFESPGAAIGQPGGCELGSCNYATEWGDFAADEWSRDARVWYNTDSNPAATAVFPDGDFAYCIDADAINGTDKLWQSDLVLTQGVRYAFSVATWANSGTGELDVNLVLNG